MKRGSLLSNARWGGLALACLALMFAAISRANAPAGRFTVASGIATDHQTGLDWQQADDGKLYTFTAAKPHCAAIGAAWRVPSMKELQTIIDESRANPAIDTSVFTSISTASTLDTCYQTSSPLAGSALGWLVCFDEGRATYDSLTNAYRVLCVR